MVKHATECGAGAQEEVWAEAVAERGVQGQEPPNPHQVPFATPPLALYLSLGH